MRIPMTSVTAIAIAVMALAAPTEAQTATQTAQRQSATSVQPTALGIRAYAAVDLDTLAAQNSFGAVLGTSQLKAFGGGADVLNVWKTAFARVAVTRLNKSGNRSFVYNGQAISLGIPIAIAMTPLEISGGWRVPTRSRVVPYGGAGLLLLQYSETSNFSADGDNVSQQKHGYTAFGGAEVALTKWFVAGVETQYRTVPNAIGAGALSQDFHETDLGGFTVRILAGFKR